MQLEYERGLLAWHAAGKPLEDFHAQFKPSPEYEAGWLDGHIWHDRLRSWAIEAVQSGEIVVDGQRVGKGQHIALLDGKIVAHADDELAALATAAQTLSGTGLFTLYVGAGVDDARREAAAGRLRATFPGAEVEVVDGGQPHYPFIVAAE